jgi:hypothetical protein
LVYKKFENVADPKIIQALKRQEGTFIFRCFGKGVEMLFDGKQPALHFMEKIASPYILRLERDNDFNVNFIHSSPGTGTRITSVNIEPLRGSPFIFFMLSWSPDAICLYAINDKNIRLVSKDFEKADYKLFVENGFVIQVGSKGVQTANYITIINGKKVVTNYAIDTWRDTTTAVNTLQKAESKEGRIFESITSCLSLTMLCTGFEVYCRKRFFEIILEGYEPNYEALLGKFIPEKYRDSTAKEAKKNGHSIAHEIVFQKRRIDFGNYENCKDAYGKGYGISLPNLVQPQLIQDVCRFILYRHKLIHATPLQDWLNYFEPEKEHVIANRATINDAIKSFNALIEALHKETLKFKPKLE